MSPAPLWPALALALLLLAGAATAATAAPQQPPARGRLGTLTYANAKTSVGGRDGPGGGGGGGGGGDGGGSDYGRFLGLLTGPQLQLLGPLIFAQSASLGQLAALGGADTVLPLFEGSLGASSGGHGNPAATGTADSSEEVADLIV